MAAVRVLRSTCVLKAPQHVCALAAKSFFTDFRPKKGRGEEGGGGDGGGGKGMFRLPDSLICLHKRVNLNNSARKRRWIM